MDCSGDVFKSREFSRMLFFFPPSLSFSTLPSFWSDPSQKIESITERTYMGKGAVMKLIFSVNY